MIVDSSAWIEYLRDTGSPTHIALRNSIESDSPIATPAPVVMELLAGCPTEAEAAQLRRFLGCFEILDIEGLADFEDAALVRRICQRGGHKVRSVIDCLIAAMALRLERPVLARDRDFEGIAQHVQLRLISGSH